MNETVKKTYLALFKKYFEEVNKLSFDSKFVSDLLAIVRYAQDFSDCCDDDYFYFESKLKLYKSISEFIREFK